MDRNIRRKWTLARAIARKAGVEFEVMDFSFIGRLGHNSLTDAGMEMDQEKPADSFPNTFVPGRNLFFLSYSRRLRPRAGGLIIL